MRSLSESPSIVSTEIDGHSPSSADKIVHRRFGKVCKLLWDDPLKPDVELAILGGVEARTARRWMRGQGDPPWFVVRAVVDRMFEPI